VFSELRGLKRTFWLYETASAKGATLTLSLRQSPRRPGAKNTPALKARFTAETSLHGIEKAFPGLKRAFSAGLRTCNCSLGRYPRLEYETAPLALNRYQTIELRCESIENHKMKTRCLDHIDLRVKDMQVARNFYGKFLPQLGFVHESPGEDFHTFFATGGEGPREFFCFSEDKNHQSNGTRIAFWANTREEVDQLAKLVREAGGKALEGPEVCADYSPGYYAFFFEDPDGNKLEICCRESPVIAE
jgi:catechol 2,3-dioxygenase-like lactoylglutathione lyase family enzyme